MKRRDALICCLSLSNGVWSTTAHGQTSYPARPIRFVFPYPVGGPGDTIARRVAESVSRLLGQPVLVDARPGASGSIGTAEVARAAPDGYTFLLTITDSLVHVNALFKKLPYDSRRDFILMTQVAASGAVLATYAEYPVSTLAELIAQATASPDAVAYGSWGLGSHPHLVMEGLRREAGIKLNHIPYKGVAPAMQDLMARQIPFAFVSANAVTASAGRLKAVAVLGEGRNPLLPTTPTFLEAGLADPIFKMRSWIGLAAPAGTPPSIVARVTDAVRAAVATPEVAAVINSVGFEVVSSTPQEFARSFAFEVELIPRLMRSLGVEAQ